MRVNNLTGNKYGRLTVLERLGNDKWGCAIWRCKCDCGNEKQVSASHLKSGATQSCGCLCVERTKQALTKHNLTDSRLYRAWHHMKNRCTNPKVDGYENYGGRGIQVCIEWMDFVPFMEWSLSNGYTEELSLDRIDVNGNYEPDNCRWTTMEEQQNNKTNNHLVTYNGITMTVSQWAKERGIQYHTLYARLTRYGWDVARAMET